MDHFTAIFFFSCLAISSAFLCDDSNVPDKGIITDRPWFKPCVWECERGYEVAGGRLCCRANEKPQNASWLTTRNNKSSSCRFRCDDGFVRRAGICCLDKPAHASWTGSEGCAWKCEKGLQRSGACCLDKPLHSTWAINTSTTSVADSCVWQCKSGFKERKGGCCRSKPAEARWSLHSTCEWRCTQGLRAVGDRCVDDVVAEVLMEWDIAESNRIVDRLVEEQLEELVQATMSKSSDKDASSSEDMVDRLVESALDRRRAEALSEADRADADVDAFAEYARAAGGLDCTNDAHVSKDADTNTPFHAAPFDSAVLDELEAEARSRVEAMVDQSEYLRATIRYQNERLRRRQEQLTKLGANKTNQPNNEQPSQQPSGVKSNNNNNNDNHNDSRKNDRLQQELERARAEATALRARSEEVQAKLRQAQKDAKTRREKVLSVDAEKVELVHGRSGEWQRVYYALLDTGNANRCTISTMTVRDLGLSDAAKKSRRKVTVLGVLPGVTEQWTVIEVQLRIKGRVFVVDAAIGGTTSLLVSHTDVIARLLKEDGYVIGAPGTPTTAEKPQRPKPAEKQKGMDEKQKPKTAAKQKIKAAENQKMNPLSFWLNLLKLLKLTEEELFDARDATLKLSELL